jgi:hypothetical protein
LVPAALHAGPIREGAFENILNLHFLSVKLGLFRVPENKEKHHNKDRTFLVV